jgi:hypothetical protein
MGGELVGHAPSEVAGSGSTQVRPPAFGGTRADGEERTGVLVGVSGQHVERESEMLAPGVDAGRRIAGPRGRFGEDAAGKKLIGKVGRDCLGEGVPPNNELAQSSAATLLYRSALHIG